MFDYVATQTQTPQVGLMGLAGFGTLGTITQNSPRDRIKLLQKQLNYYANANLAIDGILGLKTWQAVIDWEYATNVPFAHLSENFVVSDYTLNTLGIDSYDSGGGSGTQTGGGSGSTQTGGGGGARVSFEWKASAVVNVGTTWGTAQTAFGAAMRSAGFDVQYNSYEFGILNLQGWTLLVRGVSPVGMTERNAISNKLIALAEENSFNVDTGYVEITTGDYTGGGGSPSTGGGSDDGTGDGSNAGKSFLDSIQEFFDKKFGFLGGTVSGAVLILGGLAVVAFLKRD